MEQGLPYDVANAKYRQSILRYAAAASSGRQTWTEGVGRCMLLHIGALARAFR